jgi:tetratricopeptide (TPR) repeat protein
MHDQAAPALEKAIALQETLDEPDADQLSADLDNLGNALMALGDTERGLDLLKRSVEVLEADGGDPGAMANSLNRLGLCQIDVGRMAEAEASLIRARAYAQRAAGGGRHPEVADAEAAWATYRGKQGDLERMAACLRRATEETEAVWGPKHYKTAMVYLRLGNALTELGEPAEALERLQQGRSILAATAAGHVAHLQAFDLPIAQALADLGRTGEAIEVLRPLLGSANPRRAEAAQQLLTRLEG